MRAGTLRHVIAFDEPVTAQSTSGEETVTWTEAFTVRGSISPMKGREQLMAEQVNAEMDTRIRIRWSPNVDDINAKWRARHGSTVYNIVSIAHINMGQREIEIVAVSGVNNG